MNKLLTIFLITLLIAPFSTALNIVVNEESSSNVVIKEFSNPAIFELEIENNGKGTEIEIFSLSGVDISPRGFFDLPNGENTLKIEATPQESLMERVSGLLTVNYKIREKDGDSISQKLTLEILPLKKVIGIKSNPLSLDTDKATLTIINKEKATLQNIKLEISSIFFEQTTNINLLPGEEKTILIDVDKSQFSKVSAGSYVITTKVTYKESSSEISGVIDYLEKQSFSNSSDSSGAFIKKTTLSKTNQGNTDIQAALSYDHNILTRLFTTFSQKPDSIIRKGLNVEYTWEETLIPQESLIINVKTNYTLPVILILLIIVISILVKVYYTTNLLLTKRVSFVKTKGGEFALKVTLHAKARKSLEHIKIEDKIPSMVKLYDKFGSKPDTIDPVKRTLSWNLHNIRAGEERVFSYIIYSKLDVFGTFTLPAARAIFTVDGEKDVVYSNRTSYMAEQRG